MDLTVAIVAKDGKHYLMSCLKSIYENTKGIDFEVALVDNASVDGTAEFIKKEFPQTVLIRNLKNLGFAKANNQAIKQSHARYIMLLNQDTVVIDNALGKMVSFLDKHPKIGALGCKIYTSLGRDRIQHSAFIRFPSPGIVFLHTLAGASSNGLLKNRIFKGLTDKYTMNSADFDMEQDVKHLVGAAIMARAEAIKDVGMLDERFFMYLEETDWCLRMKKSGWKVSYLPSAEIVHFYDPERSSRGSQKKIRQKSYLTYLSKHHSLFALVFFMYFYGLLSIMETLSGRKK